LAACTGFPTFLFREITSPTIYQKHPNVKAHFSQPSHEDNDAEMGRVALSPHSYVHMEAMEDSEDSSKEFDSARNSRMGGAPIRKLS